MGKHPQYRGGEPLLRPGERGDAGERAARARRARSRRTISSCGSRTSSGAFSRRRSPTTQASLHLVQHAVQQGLDSEEDVASAETQLDSAIAQATDVGRRAGAVRACHRGADRRAAGQVLHSLPALQSAAARHSGGRAIGSARAAAGHRGGRAPGRAVERQIGVARAAFFPQSDAERLDRLRIDDG